MHILPVSRTESWIHNLNCKNSLLCLRPLDLAAQWVPKRPMRNYGIFVFTCTTMQFLSEFWNLKIPYGFKFNCPIFLSHFLWFKSESLESFKIQLAECTIWYTIRILPISTIQQLQFSEDSAIYRVSITSELKKIN